MLLISWSVLALCVRLFIERLESTGMGSRIQCPPYLSVLLTVSLIPLLWPSLHHGLLPWPSITLLFLQLNSPDPTVCVQQSGPFTGLTQKGAGHKSCFMQMSMLIGHIRFSVLSGRLIWSFHFLCIST